MAESSQRKSPKGRLSAEMKAKDSAIQSGSNDDKDLELSSGPSGSKANDPPASTASPGRVGNLQADKDRKDMPSPPKMVKISLEGELSAVSIPLVLPPQQGQSPDQPQQVQSLDPQPQLVQSPDPPQVRRPRASPQAQRPRRSPQHVRRLRQSPKQAQNPDAPLQQVENPDPPLQQVENPDDPLPQQVQNPDDPLPQQVQNPDDPLPQQVQNPGPALQQGENPDPPPQPVEVPGPAPQPVEVPGPAPQQVHEAPDSSCQLYFRNPEPPYQHIPLPYICANGYELYTDLDIDSDSDEEGENGPDNTSLAVLKSQIQELIRRESRPDNEYVEVHCRAIRIGTLRKNMPANSDELFPAIISKLGLYFFMPHATIGCPLDMQDACVVIPHNLVQQVKSQTTETAVPLLSFQLKKRSSLAIRETLSMEIENRHRGWFHPASEMLPERFVVFVMDSISTPHFEIVGRIYQDKLDTLERSEGIALINDLYQSSSTEEEVDYEVSD